MKRLIALCLLTLGLSGCSWFESLDWPEWPDWFDSDSSETTAAPASASGSTTAPEANRIGSNCPQVAVIRDLSVYQHPPAADENTLVISARMGNISGGCSYDDKGNLVQAHFDVVAVRGLQTAGKRAAIPFLISVLDSKDQVVRKETYEIPVVFEGDSRDFRTRVPINPRVALPQGTDASQYRVLIGFQLSKDQVDANTRFFSQMPATP